MRACDLWHNESCQAYRVRSSTVFGWLQSLLSVNKLCSKRCSCATLPTDASCVCVCCAGAIGSINSINADLANYSVFADLF